MMKRQDNVKLDRENRYMPTELTYTDSTVIADKM